jgi:hypothetical protein
MCLNEPVAASWSAFLKVGARFTRVQSKSVGPTADSSSASPAAPTLGRMPLDVIGTAFAT